MSHPDPVWLLNYVANHPDVHRHIAPGRGVIDLSAFFRHPDNVMFGDEDGLILFLAQPDNTYKLHWLLTEAVRGRRAIKMARAAFAEMFTRPNCCAIKGSTPRDNLAARQINRALGGVPTGASIDDLGRPCIDYRLERRQWAMSYKTCLADHPNSLSPAATTKHTAH